MAADGRAGETEPSLPEKVIAVDDRLTEAKLPHAFGGALALAYYAEPRVTVDIDLNLFVRPSAHRGVLSALAPLGVADDVDPTQVERDGQCQVHWGRTPIDLFFAYDDFHEAMRRAARQVPFGDRKLRVLSPEHLLVCKAAFDRSKDWIDIEQMLVTVDELDFEEISHWLARFVGDDDARKRRVDELISELR